MEEIKGYSEITDQEAMDALLGRMAGFHDSMAKELHLLNRGWVNEDRSMTMTHRYDARLLFQSQWEVVAVELLFLGVESLETGPPGDIWGGAGWVVRKAAPVEERRVSMSFDNSLKITAERLFFIERPAWTGPRARMGEEIPHPGCVPATAIGDPWRQCSACADAFEAPRGQRYVLCPGCSQLTELAEGEAVVGS